MDDEKARTICLTAASLLGKNPVGERLEDAMRYAGIMYDQAMAHEMPKPVEQADGGEEAKALAGQLDVANEKIAQLEAVIEQQMEQVVERNERLVEMQNEMNALQNEADKAQDLARYLGGRAQKAGARVENLERQIEELICTIVQELALANFFIRQ